LRLGRVEKHLRSLVESGEKLVFVLVDPEKPLPPRLGEVAGAADAVLVGGSLNITPYDMDEYIRAVRREAPGKPVIIFPGGVNTVCREADAILFMTLMNSIDPYWIIEAQVTAAPLVKRLGLEAIPSAYIIYGHGGAAGHIGRALPIPYEAPYIAAAYAAAAELLGSRLVYLEAGSGSPKRVPEAAVAAARKALDYAMLVVGGGIRSPEDARSIVQAGADAIVIGTIVERDPDKALEIIGAVKHR